MEKVKDYDVFFPMFKHCRHQDFTLAFKTFACQFEFGSRISVKLHEGPYGVLMTLAQILCSEKRRESNSRNHGKIDKFMS